MSKPGDHRAGSITGSDVPFSICIDTLPDPVLIVDTETHDIVSANGAAGDLFNCQPATLAGMTIDNLHPTDTPESGDNHVEALVGCSESGRVKRLQNGQPIEIETVAGEGKAVEINAEAFTKAGREYLLAVFRDATEQVERERELRSARSRLETLLEALPIPVAVLSPDGTVEEWNQAAENVYGYSAEEVIDETFPLFAKSDEPHNLMEKIVQSGILDGYQTIYQRQDGSHIDVELYARPLYEEEQLQGIIGAAIDITDKQRRVQQLDVLQRTLRHNIRNKLNVVQGHLEVIEAELADDSASVEAAITATNKILTRAETAQQIRAVDSDRDISEQSVSDLVTAAVHTHQATNGLTIETDVEDISVKAVKGFETAIEHAIENAIKHIEPPVNITISTHASENKIELVIEDNGAGIPKAELDALTAAEETRLEHGSGIGLWAMKWLTEQSGGRFEVESDPTGTTVTMQLPRADETKQRTNTN